MNKYAKLLFLACIGLIFTGLAGCVGAAVKPDYFTFSPMAQTSPQAPVADASHITIGMGPLVLPEYLTSRANIVASENANKLVLLENARWAEPLDSNVQMVLTENLKYLLQSPHIIHYPWRASTKYDYQVVLTVNVLTADANSATLHARYQVINSATQNITERELDLKEPLEAFDANGVVAAQNKLINRASLDIAQTLAQTANLNR